MKHVNHIAGLSVLTLAASACSCSKSQPNIIFFLVDDNGWVDSEVAYGHEVYPNNLRFNTPNMKRLSEMSVIMGQAYACPVSTPTRTSLLTGTNAAHSGITNWTSVMKDTPSDATGGGIAMAEGGSCGDRQEGDVLARPDWTVNGISPVPGIPHSQYCTPLPRILKDEGYFTIHVGKAHWAPAGTPGANPYNLGFSVNIAGTMAGMPRSYQGRDNYGNTPERWNDFAIQNMSEYYGTETHLTEALTLEALKALEWPVARKQPFYLYLAHYATHTPIQPDDRFVQKYREAGMDEGQARYASMVEGVDKSLGDVLDFIEKKGIEDNTIIIFMTDNGGNSENKGKGGILHTQNKPLREGKGSCYEGGIRVPLMFCWPSKVKEGSRCDVPVICEDMFPTILHMAGVKKYKTVQNVDGVDLVPLITKGRGVDADRPLVFHYPHKWKPYPLDDIDFLSALVQGNRKLVYRMSTGKLELYDLASDIGEEHDIASENPEEVARMAKLLGDKLREWKSPMPVLISTGQTVPMPDEIL